MPDAMCDLDSVVRQLAATHVAPTGVSFQGKSLKLDTEDDAKEVLAAMAACSNLTFLNMEGNTLGVDAAKAIAKGLESHPEMTRALWKDMFTGRMKSEIPKALQFLGQGLVTAKACLTELDLSDNAFGPIGVEGLAVLLRSPPCYTLQELRLNNNGLGISGGKMLAKALLSCHKNSKAEGKGLRLRVFIAGRNRLENEGATALAEVFRTVGTLEELAMPQNGIYHVGISALSEALRHNPGLRVLNLNDNTLTARGAAALAQVLPSLPGLRTLNLGDCLLKTKGAQLLADALKEKHTALEEVFLSCNEIGVAGGLAVAGAVANKSALRTLDLDGNQFGEEGCELLQNTLATCGRLSALTGLEEDEGEEEEEDGEDDEEDEEEEDEEEDEDEDSKTEDSEHEVDASGDSNKEKVQVVDAPAVTVAHFLQNPTGENLVALSSEKFLQYPKSLAPEYYLEQLLPVIMKVSALTVSSNNSVRNTALTTSQALLRHIFDWANQGEPSSISAVNNAVLVHLGLIKSEDKSFKLSWDVDGCLVAIENAIKNKIVPTSTKELLRFFLEYNRPNSITLPPLTKDRILNILRAA